jgi:hypothetical protein
MILSSEGEQRKEIEIMYLFYADRLGWIPMGNDGQLVVPKSIRSRRALLKLATSWLGKRAGRVYLMTSWTQQMSELGPRAFEEYIATHGEVLVYG